MSFGRYALIGTRVNASFISTNGKVGTIWECGSGCRLTGGTTECSLPRTIRRNRYG